MKKRAVLWLIAVWTVINQGSAILTIRQGRTVPGGDTSTTTIVRIATVELGGSPTGRPTYYFDCITNQNNGSGIRWTRTTTPHRFQVTDIPGGLPGKRLDAAGIDYPDLDVYTCADRYSTDVTSVDITAFNPAIMAAEETVGVVQGLTVQLEVYTSGFPIPTSSHMTWYLPNGTEITDTHPGLTFQDGKRRLILSNVQPQQAGSYECTVVLSFFPYMGAFTSILLEVYVPSTFTTHPQAIVDATEWTKVILNCSANGTPVPTISWEREGGTRLPVGAVPSYSTSGNTVTSNLTFDKVRYEHRGRYRCVADNMETNPDESQYADIRITPALRLEDERMQSVSDLYSVENEASVRLECLGTGTLQWSSSTGSQIRSAADGSGNIYQSYDHTRDALTLVIQNFTSVTIATYTCMTSLTDAHNNPITASVLITSSNPAVIIRSEIQYVLSGSSTTLEARVLASPLSQAVVQWYHGGRLIDDATESSYTASSNGDIYRLTVNGVSENEVGEYSVVVTLNGANATDRITLRFPDSPSATITPSSITVSEGEEVRFTCDAEGSGALTVTWTMSDGGPLPVGVQENGNSIYIASATSSHPGTYVCSVSNLAGTGRAEATLTVYYSPTAVVSYNRTMSMPGTQPLYLIFDDGAPGPAITCSADGYLSPTVEWIRDNGRGLPSGILQQSAPSSNGEAAVQLKWQREMEFTDSGSYICRAFNNNGTDSVTLELLVQIQPTISSISPSNSIIKQDSQQTFTFTVPLDYAGGVLTCAATGWPAPVVEWHKNNVPVPSNNGILSESTTTSSTVSARLTWTRGFAAESDEGSYQCVVYKQNTDIPVASQTVQLNARLPTTISPTSQPCSVQQTSIHFQIRVFATDCENWEEAQRAEIAGEFRGELLSVVRTECNCTFQDSSLQMSGSAQCSTKVNGAAVFHGWIETGSQRETELIFCSLLSWQQKSSLIRINDQLRAVDNNCSLEASGSSNSEECIAPTNPAPILGLIEIVAIAGGGAGFVLLLGIILLICCLCCCYCRRRRGKFNTKDDHIYTRTESFSRYSRDGVGVLSRNGRHPGMIRGEEATYSTLTQETMDHQSHPYPESIALSQIHSTSSENLISSENIDGTTRVPSRARIQQTEPEAYQIPVSSRENLTSVGRMDSVGRFPTGTSKRLVSSTSSYDSTSHLLNRVQNPRPSNSSIEDNTNDYEDISGDDGSVCDSPTPAGKAHGRLSVGSAHIYHQLTESRKHSDAPVPPTFFLGESSPQLRGVVSGSAISNGFTHASGSQMMPNSGSRPRRTSETTRTPLQQQPNRIGDGNHTTGSSSSPHIMKQELVTQFQSVDHMASRPRAAGQESSNHSKLPPPSTFRPSSDAILHTESGRDSAMIDNAAYGGINHEQRPWYSYDSDMSLNSSTPQIVPVRTNLNNPSTQLRSDSRQRSEFTQVQPYAELSPTTEV